MAFVVAGFSFFGRWRVGVSRVVGGLCRGLWPDLTSSPHGVLWVVSTKEGAKPRRHNMNTYEDISTEDALEAIKDGTLSLDSVFINYGGTADRPTAIATVGANVTYRDAEGDWAKLVTVFDATEYIDVTHDWGEQGYVDARAEVISAASGWLERLGYRVGAAKYPRGDWYGVERI